MILLTKFWWFFSRFFCCRAKYQKQNDLSVIEAAIDRQQWRRFDILVGIRYFVECYGSHASHEPSISRLSFSIAPLHWPVGLGELCLHSEVSWLSCGWGEEREWGGDILLWVGFSPLSLTNQPGVTRTKSAAKSSRWASCILNILLHAK